MDSGEIMHFDVEEILKQKLPEKKISKFAIRYLKKILHQDEINQLFVDVHGKENLEFIEIVLRDFLQVTNSFEGVERLPSKDGQYIFVSNHPLGGLDSLILGWMLGEKYDGKVKFYANELLMSLTPLKELFIPVNNLTGVQSRENAKLSEDFFLSDNQLITFPAGTCSRKVNGKVQDLKWKKSFVNKSVKYQRDVVPIYFDGQNSKFFYNLSKFRTKLGLPNIEMLYLVNEMFKQKGKHFRVVVGEPISYKIFDKSKNTQSWASWVKEKVYELA